MGKINWKESLGWTEEQIEEIRYTAFAYIRQGKYDIALPIFESLAVLDPESAYDHQTLGALYLQIGSPNKALKSFDRALKLEADHTPTLLNLTKTFFLLGKKDEGLRLAELLTHEKDLNIANTARALIMAYGS